MCHRDRLKAWKPDDQLTRELATLNEGRRHAVDRRTELANEIKSQLKLYFPVALQILDNDITTALAADLLVQWPTLAELQKVSPGKLRKFFYGHNCRQEKKILERLALINQAKPLTTDVAIIRPTALRVELLAQQLKSLLPFIAEYEKRIAELFGSHPDRFLFDNLPGAGPALAPRLLTAFGTDRCRFEVVGDLLNLTGIAPVRIASGKTQQHPLPHEPAQSSCDSPFTSSLPTRSASAPGLKPTIKPKSPEAKVTTLPYGRWPLNGSASCLPAGKTAFPTIPIDT